jgi:D-sedoheptulose 7-phosphate isomerase
MKIKEEFFFINYFLEINKKINCIDSNKLEEISNLLLKTSNNNNKVIIVGNGGSASIADHLTVDFINAAGIRALNFNNSSIITCFSNDYGYENWVAKALDCYANSGDVVIFISSSGQSKNMIIGAERAKYIGLEIITLTGFLPNNPLRGMGNINFWVDSKTYNVIEATHNIWLLSVVDYIISEKNG